MSTVCTFLANVGKEIEERILNVKRRAARNERKQLKEQGVLEPKGKAGRRKNISTTTAVPGIPEGEELGHVTFGWISTVRTSSRNNYIILYFLCVCLSFVCIHL
jgi:hypothetical protein